MRARPASAHWGGGDKASVSDCLPLAAPIGLSLLLILTLCGSGRVLVVSTEPPDDFLTTPGVGRPGDGLLPRAVDQGHPDAHWGGGGGGQCTVAAHTGALGGPQSTVAARSMPLGGVRDWQRSAPKSLCPRGVTPSLPPPTISPPSKRRGGSGPGPGCTPNPLEPGSLVWPAAAGSRDDH